MKRSRAQCPTVWDCVFSIPKKKLAEIKPTPPPPVKIWAMLIEAETFSSFALSFIFSLAYCNFTNFRCSLNFGGVANACKRSAGKGSWWRSPTWFHRFFPPAFVNSQIAQVNRPKILERMVSGSSPLCSKVFVTSLFSFSNWRLRKF